MMFLFPAKKVLLQRLLNCIISKDSIDRTKSDGKELFFTQVEGLGSKFVFIGRFREKDTFIISLYTYS